MAAPLHGSGLMDSKPSLAENVQEKRWKRERCDGEGTSRIKGSAMGLGGPSSQSTGNGYENMERAYARRERRSWGFLVGRRQAMPPGASLEETCRCIGLARRLAGCRTRDADARPASALEAFRSCRIRELNAS
ncbi:hypothetical protein DPSP01_005186 [Paraphaeosphaeria sporulosa]